MSLFKPNGTAQIALARLADGAVSKHDVRRALALPKAKLFKVHALVENLRADGLVSRRLDGFHLTRLGREVLALLRAGEVVEVAFGRLVAELAA